jgi:multidrug efflux pump subunit AcrA (membrane-fusion protein)
MKFNIQLVTAFIPLILLSGCGEEKKEKEEILRPVKYEVVGSSEASQIRIFSGVAKAGDEIDLSFRASGIVTKLNAVVGQKVKKGALIAKLDNVQANLAYEQSVAALNSASSAKNTAKSSLDRIKSLYEKGSNSLSDYENAKKCL